MIKLRSDKNNIIVLGEPDSEIFNWEHRIFFTTISGYQLNEELNQYIFSDKTNLIKSIKQTISYLIEENIAFEADEQISSIISKINNEQSEFEKARDAKISIVDNKVLSISPIFVRPLRQHQIQGIEHLKNIRHGANFSVPGSGKTTVIYAVFEQSRQNKEIEKLLVIGPRSCFWPWEDESNNCFNHPLSAVRLIGPKASRQSAYLQAGKYDLLLCTYQTAANDLEEIIDLCRRFKMFVVIDESHNIKRLEGGVWSQAVLNIAPYATKRAILTGTPMPNDLVDLWSQITFLWPGEQVLGNREQYRYRCENENEYESIKQAIQPFFFRTKKAELGLPPIKTLVHECKLKPYQESIYKALAIKTLHELNIQPAERQALRQWRKAKLVRLLQAASNPTLLTQYSEEFNLNPLRGEGVSILQIIDKYPEYETPVKFELTNDLVRKLLLDGEKVVIWTTFIHNIKMLRKYFEDIDPFVVYGAVPKDESEDSEFNREQQIRNFKETANPNILIANPAACAESISLHKACHHAVYIDRTFNCGQYMQSLDRLHRIGLRSDEIVTYHIMFARNTIDGTIDRRLAEKQEKMLRLLEDDLPIGTFEVEQYEMVQTDDEEQTDFQETIKDLQQQLDATEP